MPVRSSEEDAANNWPFIGGVMRLQGKVAIVTGAGGGIGRAIAMGFAREGASVVVDDRLPEHATDTADSIRTAGGRAASVCADVADLAEHDRLIDVALKEFGALDVLVNNAGVEFHEPVLESSSDVWEKTLGVNLRGPYFLSCKAAAVMARAGGGKIIHIASVHDVQPLQDRAIYSISKGGVAMLVKSLALELAQHNIFVNAISPGAVLTDMTRASLSNPVEHSKLLDRVPLKRVGQPEDIVGAAIFLACSESDYVTGTTIYVDGGFLLL
jgi:NAD(P)-dependent dehydrogenase (short-subunit alcohol dehydrogenase family)